MGGTGTGIRASLSIYKLKKLIKARTYNQDNHQWVT